MKSCHSKSKQIVAPLAWHTLWALLLLLLLLLHIRQRPCTVDSSRPGEGFRVCDFYFWGQHWQYETIVRTCNKRSIRSCCCTTAQPLINRVWRAPLAVATSKFLTRLQCGPFVVSWRSRICASQPTGCPQLTSASAPATASATASASAALGVSECASIACGTFDRLWTPTAGKPDRVARMLPYRVRPYRDRLLQVGFACCNLHYVNTKRVNSLGQMNSTKFHDIRMQFLFFAK